MDKIVLKEEGEICYKSIMHNGQEIKIKEYLTINDQSTIVRAYISNYFSDTNGQEVNIILAEYALKAAIIDLATNIDLEKTNIDDVTRSDLYGKITMNIFNYLSLIEIIKETVKLKYHKTSPMSSFTSLLDAGKGLVNKFAESDLSPEAIKELLESASQIKDMGWVNEVADKFSGKKSVEESAVKTEKVEKVSATKPIMTKSLKKSSVKSKK